FGGWGWVTPGCATAETIRQRREGTTGRFRARVRYHRLHPNRAWPNDFRNVALHKGASCKHHAWRAGPGLWSIANRGWIFSVAQARYSHRSWPRKREIRAGVSLSPGGAASRFRLGFCDWFDDGFAGCCDHLLPTRTRAAARTD